MVSRHSVWNKFSSECYAIKVSFGNNTTLSFWFLQATFQTVIVTDGNISFTLFIYENFTQLKDSLVQRPFNIGFDEGNAVSAYVLDENENLAEANNTEFLFRVDGKQLSSSRKL